MATFMAVILGNSLFTWYVGGLFIEWGKINPQTGKVYNTVDIMIVYQCFMLSFLSLAGVMGAYPAS